MNKYKKKFNNLFNKLNNDNIYISIYLPKDDINYITKKLKKNFYIELIDDIKYIDLNIYNNDNSVIITNIYKYHNTLINKFNKIIYLPENIDPQTLLNYENKSITCKLVYNIVNYYVENNIYKTELSYIIHGNTGMGKYYLHKKLNNWNLLYINNNINKVDYIRQEIDYKILDNFTNVDKSKLELKKTKNINCILKNIIDINNIYEFLNKKKLYDLIQSNYTNYLSFVKETFDLNNFKNTNDKLWIFKPIGKLATIENGIFVVSNDKEYKKIMKKIKILEKENNCKYIVCEYISNPLLFKNKKCHFRCYLLVSTFNKISLFSEYRIMSAKKKYKNSDFDNKDIHDTHGNEYEDLYPNCNINDFNDITEDKFNKINSKIKESIDYVINLINKIDIKTFPEIMFGYQILGVDILLNDTCEIAYILEINTHIEQRLNSLDERYDLFSKNYLEWEYNTAIKPIFSQIEFVQLHKINDNQLNELLKLTTDKKLMLGIGLGEKWNKDKLLKMILDSKNEENIDAYSKKYFDWFVIHKYSINDEKSLIGYVSLRPMIKYTINNKQLKIDNNDMQGRILTIPSQGYGYNIALELIKIVKKLNKRFYGVIHEDNTLSQGLLKKLGFEKLGNVSIGGINNIVFKMKE